jgi:hypothetical protein
MRLRHGRYRHPNVSQRGMQMRHQHRRRHSFARHIAQSKIERVGSCWNQIDIVAAYKSGRFVGKRYLPVAQTAAPLRKQAQLDLPCQLQLSLQIPSTWEVVVMLLMLRCCWLT